MFLKKLVGRTDMENALQRLENMTLEETRMTGAEALKAIHDVKRMIHDMLQGKVINIASAQTVQFLMSSALIVYMVRC
jgi:hypothetical protein